MSVYIDSLINFFENQNTVNCLLAFKKLENILDMLIEGS